MTIANQINYLKSGWVKTSNVLPIEGKVVQTIIVDDKGERNNVRLKRVGDLWFVPDGSMFVYYTPTHWRF